MITGTDKALRKQHVIKILKKRDTQRDEYELSDIIKEDYRTYDQESFQDEFLGPLMRQYNPIIVRVPLAYGILGFVRFLKGFYLILISKKTKVAMIGNHSIYQVKDTQMIPLFKDTLAANRDDESKYLQIFHRIEIGTGFYFSYTYDLTRSL